MGGGDNGCGSGLLGVTSNKFVTFPRQNIRAHPAVLRLRLQKGGMGGGGIRNCGTLWQLHSPDRTAFFLRAHAALSGECNYYVPTWACDEVPSIHFAS